MREFEYDISKSLSNEDKHGISFEVAQKLWNDPEAITLEADERGEIRYLLIARLYDKHWSAIFTYRQLKIRMISVRRSRKMWLMSMKASELDCKFDENQEDVLEHLDLSTATRINHKQKRINVDFPEWVVSSLDREASRIGVTRQSIIKMWLVERLESQEAYKNMKTDNSQER